MTMEVVPTDVSDPASVAVLFSTTRDVFGRLDLLFNNAGTTAPAIEFEDISYEKLDSGLGTNLTGPFLCTQQAFRIMKEQHPHGGRIINNGSISAYVPRPRSAPYTTTKHRITGLTRSTSSWEAVRYRLRPDRIGNAATEMSATVASEAEQPDGTMLAEPRIDVECVARAVVYMASLPLDANVLFLTIMATKMPHRPWLSMLGIVKGIRWCGTIPLRRLGLSVVHW